MECKINSSYDRQTWPLVHATVRVDLCGLSNNRILLLPLGENFLSASVMALFHLTAWIHKYLGIGVQFSSGSHQHKSRVCKDKLLKMQTDVKLITIGRFKALTWSKFTYQKKVSSRFLVYLFSNLLADTNTRKERREEREKGKRGRREKKGWGRSQPIICNACCYHTSLYNSPVKAKCNLILALMQKNFTEYQAEDWPATWSLCLPTVTTMF